MKNQHVIVVGGGFAGLAAAVRLTEAGARVTLLEQRKMLGGRAHSFKDPRTGADTDNGQHLLISAYHETMAFLETIGTAGKVRFQEKLEVPYRDPEMGRTVWLRCPNLPAPFHLLVGVLGLDNLSWKDKLAFMMAGLPLLRLRFGVPKSLDEISVAEYLDRMGQTPALRRAVWDPIVIATLNEVPEKVSAYLLGQVLEQGFLSSRKNSMLGVATVGLSELYVNPARAWLETRGAQIRTGATVKGVRAEDGRVSALELTDGETVNADAYVLALSPKGMASLAKQPPFAGEPFFAGVEKIESSPIVSINLWYDRPLQMEADYVGLLDSPVQWVFDRQAILGEGEPGRHPYALITSAAELLGDTRNRDVTEIAIEAITEAFPEAREAKLVHASVVKEPHATFSAAPGFEKLRCTQKTPIENLFLAGDWTDTDLPATIEAAVESAVRAVREVCRYLGD